MELVRHHSRLFSPREASELTNNLSVVVSVFAIVILSIIGGLFRVRSTSFDPLTTRSSLSSSPPCLLFDTKSNMNRPTTGRTPLDGRLVGRSTRRQSSRRISLRSGYSVCRLPRLLWVAGRIAHEAEQ